MSNETSVTVLDDASPGPFEGPEKLLELWFAPSEQAVIDRQLPLKGGRKGKERWTGLRQVERSTWEGMLDEVCCKVLSVIEGEETDAYLLSESSMFVWPHKLILKTCGTTTLLLGLPTLLRIASEICGFNGVWRCFYSRKTFMFPDRQRGPHKDWTQEMSFLDKLFENSSAYTVGRMNGDHWLLYITPPRDDVLLPHALESSNSLPPSNPKTPLSSLSTSLSTTPSALPPTSPRKATISLPPATRTFTQHEKPDQTLEILMTQMSPRACRKFYHPSSTPADPVPYTTPLLASSSGAGDAHELGAILSDELGLTAILPGATLDSFLFAPCGFSQNAVRGDRYATVHVTPEEAYSYASFECNFDFERLGRTSTTGNQAEKNPNPFNLVQLVEKVLDIFEPDKISITLFVSDDDEQKTTHEKKGRAHEGMNQLSQLSSSDSDSAAQGYGQGKYERVDRILYEFEGYSLVYAVFQKRQTQDELQITVGGEAEKGTF
ncbi:adenosylmethionine decarboxylase SPE2 [Sporobolomyces koalae]|uniref:adenosylmethionine decarboxylase SPE2 n=1 Tax=Sporobolomyces koalae TaxID=500713 RepID=UPI00316C92B9